MAERTSANGGTRERILEAAGEIFAEKGFHKATIREIVARADANLNAVNYYFRDKQNLYLAVFEYAHRHAAERDRADFSRMQGLPPRERLQAQIEHLLRGFLSRERRPWQVKLMVREMTEPSGALDVVVDRLIRPRFEGLVSVVRVLVDPDVPLLQVRLLAESIVAQCVHISHGRPIVSRLIPELTYSSECMELLAGHIAAFSLAALDNMTLEGSPHVRSGAESRA